MRTIASAVLILVAANAVASSEGEIAPSISSFKDRGTIKLRVFDREIKLPNQYFIVASKSPGALELLMDVPVEDKRLGTGVRIDTVNSPYADFRERTCVDNAAIKDIRHLRCSAGTSLPSELQLHFFVGTDQVIRVLEYGEDTVNKIIDELKRKE